MRKILSVLLSLIIVLSISTSTAFAATTTAKAKYVKNYKMKTGTYTGYLLNNRPNGQGVMYFTDGSIYNGNWLGGGFQGSGNLIKDKGDIVIIGEWQASKLTGWVEIYEDYDAELGYKTVYIGNVVDGMYEGFGILRENYVPDSDSTGVSYVGYFSDNQMHGYGVVYDCNLERVGAGYFYQGEFIMELDLVAEDFLDLGLEDASLHKDYDINPTTDLNPDGSLKPRG